MSTTAVRRSLPRGRLFAALLVLGSVAWFVIAVPWTTFRASAIAAGLLFGLIGTLLIRAQKAGPGLVFVVLALLSFLGFALSFQRPQRVESPPARNELPAVEQGQPSLLPAPSPTPLLPTQTLPATCTYTVRQGQTLFRIGREVGVDWRALADWNDLPILPGDRVIIYPGQSLTTCPPSGSVPAGRG